ncbi:MAG: hypothetical protein ACXWQE_07570 [Bdellovibrionales bacterium]
MPKAIGMFSVIVSLMVGSFAFAHPSGIVPSNARNPSYNAFLYQEFMSYLQAKFGSVSVSECDASQLADNQACYFYSGGQECRGAFNTSSAWHYYPDRIIFSCGGSHTVVNRSPQNIAKSRRFLESLHLAYPEKFDAPVHRGRCTYSVVNGQLVAYGWCT